jgi:hypothetical protein
LLSDEGLAPTHTDYCAEDTAPQQVSVVWLNMAGWMSNISAEEFSFYPADN